MRRWSWGAGLVLAVAACGVVAACGEDVRNRGTPLTTQSADAGLLDAAPMFDPDDQDHDGYTPQTGDCDENDPLKNPGAFEYIGNNIDDDCDGAIDEPTADCDVTVGTDASNAEQLAAAMNVCEKDKFLLEAKFVEEKTRVDQRSIRTSLGPIVPRAGKSFLMLSNGVAAAPGEMGFKAPGTGTGIGTKSPRPAPYADNPKCPKATDTNVNDLADIQLKLKAPTNAKSFKISFRFLSGEYPQFYCSSFNDAFAAVVRSSRYVGKNGKNVAYDSNGEFLGVNVAFWSICKNSDKYMGCKTDPATMNGSGYGATDTGGPHGATEWVTTTVPVTPGESFTLRLAIWDESDGILDSSILIDDFRWEIEPTDQETTVVDPK